MVTILPLHWIGFLTSGEYLERSGEDSDGPLVGRVFLGDGDQGCEKGLKGGEGEVTASRRMSAKSSIASSGAS